MDEKILCKDTQAITEPKISVLVPIYNTKAYLRQCLDSLCNQSFENFEVICINDGSTDESLAIINDYIKKDSRFRVISKNNSGYGDSMNQGLKAAKGKYISILESDDFAKTDMLHLLYKAITDYDADVAVGNYYIYHNEEKQLEFCELLARIPNAYNRILEKEEQYILASITPSIWKGIYRKEFLEEKNIDFLPTKGASFQDTSFAFKAYIGAKKVAAIKEPVLCYRRDHMTASVKDISKVFCVCDEFMEIKSYIERQGCKEWFSVYAQSLLDKYFWNYNRIEGENKEKFLRRYIQEVKECVENGWLEKEKAINRNKKIFENVFK